MDSGKTVLAEICVDGNGHVSTNSGSDGRKWDEPLARKRP